ncbi:50S ribosomal protein L30 [Desulfovibrio sp. OttesenSCG-928-I05]|nr:50S ribosomal protein L30 [Desulfovibrio sp. OttesenSCG-928-I05]
MIKVKLIRSKIGCQPKQRAILAAMGLRKIHQVKEFEDTAAIRGMIAKVPHMVEVES